MKDLKNVINSVSCFLNKYPLHIVFLHLTILIAVYTLLYFVGFLDRPFKHFVIEQWDVDWYRSIADKGYVFAANQQCNLVFFPLFPYVWKITGLGMLGISLLNFSFMLISFIIIYKNFKLTKTELLLFLSTPTLFFCYVPYSDAIFFFACSILLIGLYKNQISLAIIGIIIGSFCRSAAMIFVPAIIFSFIMEYSEDKTIKRKIFFKYITLMLTSVICTLLVNLIQYLQTGKFFAIFSVLKYWGGGLKIPSLPLASWDGIDHRVMWIDALAFLIGLISSIYCISFFVKKIKNLRFNLNPAISFSFGYLSVITIYILMFSKVDGNGDTFIGSLNRYIFTSPFFILFILYIFNNVKINRQSIATLAITFLVVCFLFGLHKNYIGIFDTKSPEFIMLMSYCAILLYTMLYFIMIKIIIRKNIWVVVYLINLVIQFYFFKAYMNALWVG